MSSASFLCFALWATVGADDGAPATSDLPANRWVKISPAPNAPPSPRLGYEGACVWDSKRQLFLRYGGHNQGGGGEQNSEIWTFEPKSRRWTHLLPNTSPPGVCCDQQNVFDETSGRYLRFPSFSGSHGWQWFREIYLNDSTAWVFDVDLNLWRDLRPWPNPAVGPLRCASWDSDFQVAVIFGGEGNSEGTVVYDPRGNQWVRTKPDPQPAFRSGGNMAYDPIAKKHVLFGSQFDNDPHTWTYDLPTNTWRSMQPKTTPPSNKNDAVLTYDAGSQRIVALVKISEGEGDNQTHKVETWTYHTQENNWTKMTPPEEPDPAGNRTRQLSYAPQLGAVLLENRPSNTSRTTAGKDPEQQIWLYRAAEWKAEKLPLPLAQNARTGIDENGILYLAWDQATDPRVTRWKVERGQGPQVWRANFQPFAELQNGSIVFADQTPPGQGGVVFYSVRAMDAQGRLGPPQVIRTQPRLVEEVVVSVPVVDQVRISWKAPVDKKIMGYHVDRAPVQVLSEDQLKPLKGQTPPLDPPSVGGVLKVGEFTRLTASPVLETSFVDTTVNLSQPTTVEGPTMNERRFSDEHLDKTGQPYARGVYAYRVVSVNRRGEFSGPSPGVLTIPSIPQHVFSREEETTCRIKWKPNPEANILGYRVYRMDGRFKEAKIQRLTPQPIRETEYVDPNPGKETRRYYVVAVDALGQEGQPSSPVWYRREWQDFYKPFVGEWHQ